MSRFSSIDGEHSAMRDLERQRLERMMGKLRREIAPMPQGGDKMQRRCFQPPLRKGERLPKKPSSARAPSPRPGAEAEAEAGDRAPSAEMAWLLRARDRMEEEAGKVEALLARHGLEKYASLLIDGPAASLEELRSASEELLEEAGLPASPRRRLLKALKDEDETTEGPTAAAARIENIQWGCLGRVPSGWHHTGASESRPPTGPTRAAPATFADACTGDDAGVAEAVEDPGYEISASSAAAAAAMAQLAQASPTPAEVGEDEDFQAAVDEWRAQRESQAEIWPTPPAAPMPLSRPPSGARPVVRSRPATAQTRPGSSSGVEKACCYQCFRQVYASSALRLPPDEEAEASRPATPATPAAAAALAAAASKKERIFCGDACMGKYRQALADRRQREAELFRLRSAMLEGESNSPDAAAESHGNAFGSGITENVTG
mmetsp:Transcript_106950/g.190137  ORF Transcript_106950/g.190137 Transcript_106950/m.190137 type:complete len:434 (-) Transcript_106950:79-1380(-)